MEVITKEWLSSGPVKPCQDELDIFNAHWPNGAEVTLENMQEAQKLGLGIEWVIFNLLPASYWKQYQEDIAPYREQYYKDNASLTAQYYKEIVSLTAQCQKDTASVWMKMVRSYLPRQG